ncbi:MAG: galactose mutarotase [Sedimentisphaerales bacterium]|nr:galactose mutarotase [Sedimentisphaerales bacterium]
MKITKEQFGKTTDGKAVEIYTLVNDTGSEVKITNYGGIIVSLKVPDKKGNMDDIVLGYKTLNEYIKNSPYFGALIGRYGNRIAKGKFNLNGKTYTLAINDGPNHLHGGLIGFDKVIWDVKEIKQENAAGLELSYFSKDGEEGYPGNLNVTVKYLWTNENELKIEYAAATDKTTIVNLTSHSYFNLAGKGDNMNHEMMINADKFTPVDETLIPTGQLQSVKGTPFDFTKPAKIGSRIDDDNEQLKRGKGYDHNWAINNYDGSLRKIACVYEPTSGRFMEVSTTEPGVQFYSGNYLNETMVGKDGVPYKARSGFCLETQHFPDAPNKPEFTSTKLEPGQKYSTTTIYKFSVK